MYSFMIWFSLFIIVSFLGWVMEMFYITIETKKISNRGFLLGPYCPIYGASSLLMVVCLQEYKNDMIVLFVMSVLVCSIMEYITGYFMEKIFKARWWDYSHMTFNINGRICLLNSMLFGVGAILLLKYIIPFTLNSLYNCPHIIFYCISGILLLLFFIDCIVSFNIIFKFKHTIESIQKDYTGEISENVKKVIMEKSYPFRRLIMAFPNQIILGIKSGIQTGKEFIKKRG